MSYSNFELIEEVALPNGERGIRARKTIEANSIIGIYDGKTIPITTVNGKIAFGEVSHREIVQIALVSETLYGMVTPKNELWNGIDFINHSCKPNVYAKDRVILMAQRDISEGEPLTMDYRAWDLIPEGVLCWCDDPQCRI